MNFLKKITQVVTLLASFFFVVAVFDYHPEDPSYLHATAKPATNIMMKHGANLADPIVQAFGYTIILPLLFFIYFSIFLLLKREIKFPLIKVGTLILTLPLFCFLVAIIDGNTIMDGDYYSFHFGGYLGYFLYTEALYSEHFKLYITSALASAAAVLLFETGLIERCFIRLTKGNLNEIHHFKPYDKKFKVKDFFAKIFDKQASVKLQDTIPVMNHEGVVDAQEIFFKRQQSFPETKVFDMKTQPIAGQDLNSSEGVKEAEKPQEKKAFSSDDILLDSKVLPLKTERRKERGLEFDFNFILPSSAILHKTNQGYERHLSEEELEDSKAKLLEVLNDFGIRGEITEVFYGPVVSLYALEPVSGTKSSRVIGLADDIARSMKVSSARIAVIQGKNAIGIEIPNEKREIINLKDILESPQYRDSETQLPLALGKNIAGEIVVVDLAKMPHLLVAGTTGSGKSVSIHSMILSLLCKYGPDECKLIMIDPKMLEMSVYSGIAHLLAPVVTTPEAAIATMKWVVKEMGARYRAMSVLGVRNIISYNNLIREAQKRDSLIEKQVQTGFNSETKQPIFESIVIKPEILPYIVVIIDEMADLMVVAGKEIESSVQRLAQMARAAGIHLIMATQRPSVDVITGVIKANLPTRISFQVASKFDSRTILGEMGAEQLLGAGDMLYMMPGGKIERIHGAYVEDSDIEEVANHIRKQRAPDYVFSIAEEPSLD